MVVFRPHSQVILRVEVQLQPVRRYVGLFTKHLPLFPFNEPEEIRNMTGHFMSAAEAPHFNSLTSNKSCI